MFRSVRPYLERAGIPDPVVCYQGAVVAEPESGEFLLHEPIPLELAREAIGELEQAGYPPNCYVDDELAVSKHTPYSEAYAAFQHLPVTEVGNLLDWLDRPADEARRRRATPLSSRDCANGSRPCSTAGCT